MSTFDRLAGQVRTTLDKGSRRLDDFRDDRRRRELLTELGRLTYERHCGNEIEDAAVAAVTADLDDLAREIGGGESSDGAEAVA